MVTGQVTDTWRFELYLIGDSRQSQHAMDNFRGICDNHLQGQQYHVDVYDVGKHPELLMQNGMCAAPVLVKKYPLPEKILIGDLSSTGKVLEGLGLGPARNRHEDRKSYADGLMKQGLYGKPYR